MSTRYRELLKQYLEMPMSSSPPIDLSDALEREEHRILDTPPPGCRKGLIEQPDYRFKSYELRHAPALSEVMETIPEQDWPEYIADPDCCSLKPYSWYIYLQRFGSCASAAATNQIVLRRKLASLPDVKLNPLFAYRHVNGGVDGGSSLAANVDWMLEHGTCSEDVWPNSNGWRPTPPDAAYEDAKRHRFKKVARIRNKEEFGSSLIYGLPLYWGYTGHAITGGAPLDRTRFWYLNSWGINWGENGWGTSTFSSILWSYGVWVVLAVTPPSDET